MKTKKKSNLRYLLIGAAVALAAYVISGWDDVVRGITDAQEGKPYNYEQAE
ncbi:hypothetical protein POKO110462_16030 [Pontibacter korlensis]|uniref:hypothetical protein n=1 Tax=Pontibacter korlensis TaxID=400092 RepID=UPI000A4F3DED|nr:hypothetical protein [Pontibacter korlensis]